MPPTEWTIATLKEHFETLLKSAEAKSTADLALLTTRFDSAQEALEKQAEEYERRLSDLNHEAARIAAANASNVSREVYESDKKSDEEWKRRTEAALTNTVPQTEFRSYKESTSTALTLQAGKREGVGITGQTIFTVVVAVAAVVAIVIGIADFLARPSAPTTVYLQSAAPPGDAAKK
jgi:hypothetical protein